LLLLFFEGTPLGDPLSEIITEFLPHCHIVHFVVTLEKPDHSIPHRLKHLCDRPHYPPIDEPWVLLDLLLLLRTRDRVHEGVARDLVPPPLHHLLVEPRLVIKLRLVIDQLLLTELDRSSYLTVIHHIYIFSSLRLPLVSPSSVLLLHFLSIEIACCSLSIVFFEEKYY